jgi:hypothetical protein
VADLSSCRHLSQVASSVSPSLKRCHLRWQCPVSNPTTHPSWSLFSLNRSFVLLAEGPDISPFACLSPVEFYLKTETKFSLRNVMLQIKKQDD